MCSKDLIIIGWDKRVCVSVSNYMVLGLGEYHVTRLVPVSTPRSLTGSPSVARRETGSYHHLVKFGGFGVELNIHCAEAHFIINSNLEQAVTPLICQRC